MTLSFNITLNLKDPMSFIIQSIFSLYQDLNWGPSDPETDMMVHFNPEFKHNLFWENWRK